MKKRSSHMKSISFISAHLGAAFTNINAAKPSPPFSSTIFINPDIIREDDKTNFLTLTDGNPIQNYCTMFDRRIGLFSRVNAYIFNADYSDGLKIEVQVNPEFEFIKAKEYALQYATVIGRLPKALRKDVKTVWIHDGVYPFGGGNENLLIHVGQGEEYIKQGILEETFVHEASHVSLDPYYNNNPQWLNAQETDPNFISTYALDNPSREDIAESFLLYLAFKYRRDRITDELANIISSTIPNRIQFFDSLKLDMSILEKK